MTYKIDEAAIVEIVEGHFRKVLSRCPERLGISVWFDPELNQVWASVNTDPDEQE